MRRDKGHNPVGVDDVSPPIPKVALADSGNLGLEDGTPSGFFSSLLNARDAAGATGAETGSALKKVREFARFYGIHRQTLASHLNINFDS